MRAGLRISHREKSPVSDGLVLFAFFAAGAAAAYFGAFRAPAFSEPRLFFCGLMSCVLLFSPSGVGNLLLPPCALLLGLFVEQSAMLWTESWLSDGRLELFGLLPSLVLVPLFFLAAAHGMAASAAVQLALQRCSPTARAVFHRELSLVFLFVLIALTAIFAIY